VRGVGAAGEGGDAEPSLQVLFDLFQIPNNVGDDNPANSLLNSDEAKCRQTILGPNEITAPVFRRFDTTLPVSVELLAVYGPTDNDPVVTWGWYAKGQPEPTTTVLTVHNTQGQTVYPQFDGSTTFTPNAEEFGFQCSWPFFASIYGHIYTEDALNTFTGAVPHNMRVYPFRTPDGVSVPNSYIITTEEYTAAFDFQDIIVVVRNVVPANSTVAPPARYGNFPARRAGEVCELRFPPLGASTITNTNTNTDATQTDSNNTQSTATEPGFTIVKNEQSHGFALTASVNVIIFVLLVLQAVRQ